MAREVNNQQPFQDKVVKLVPTEIVGAYLVILGIVSPAESAGKEYEYTLIGAFVVLLILTPVYLWKVSGVTNRIQLLVSTLSYVIWIYTLTYPFKYWNWYYPTVGAVVLILWSLITPIFVTPSSPPQDGP
jgi:hypothetical protein